MLESLRIRYEEKFHKSFILKHLKNLSAFFCSWHQLCNKEGKIFLPFNGQELVPLIRISVLKETLDEVELKIEGQLVGVDTKVLEEEGTHWLARKGRLVLDLSDLQHIDRQGIALLKGWENESLVVRGASEFVQALMVRHGLNLVNNEGRDRDSVKGLL